MEGVRILREFYLTWATKATSVREIRDVVRLKMTKPLHWYCTKEFRVCSTTCRFSKLCAGAEAWRTDRPTDWLSDWLCEWQTDHLTECLIEGLIDGMTYWPNDWLTERLIDRWIGWFGWLVISEVTYWRMEYMTCWATDGGMDGQTDRRTDRQTDWQTDG